jgi:hypothetical protein
MICEYCNKVLATSATLKIHQARTKYCLTIQQKTKVVCEEVVCAEVVCTYCSKSMAKRNLSRHLISCKDKKVQNGIQGKLDEANKRIITLEAENRLLLSSKECVEKIAQQPKTTTNNMKLTILSALALSEDRVRRVVEDSFTRNHFLEGQKGVARFAVDHLLKDDQGKLNYICTDPSRHTYRFKEGDNEIKDVKGKRLTTALAPPVSDKSHRLAVEEMGEDLEKLNICSENFSDIKGMNDDNSDFRAELATMISN